MLRTDRSSTGMRRATSPLPRPLQDYLTNSGFWAGPFDFDFWYAVSHEEYFWLHLRRAGGITLAITFFSTDDGVVDVDLYNLSRAPVHGLRATIVRTPLWTIDRYQPSHPLVALRLSDGASHFFTLPPAPTALADEWFADALASLHRALNDQWRVIHVLWDAEQEELLELWPSWAGPPPS